MKNYFKFIFLIVLLVVVSGCVKKVEKNKILIINNKVINIEIADDFRERVQGLSGRDSLCDDCGLLFLFDNKDKHSFWMKDMKFSIDIIWIDDDKIVYIVENALLSNGDNIPSYIPMAEADKVLEVNNGFIKENNIKLGDKVELGSVSKPVVVIFSFYPY